MRKIFSVLLLCSATLSTLNVLAAPVTGSKTIGTDYATLALAIADLNTNGISGNVTINVPAGYTETAPSGGYMLGSATLNASASASATLTIQKSGAGTNPLLTAYTGTSTTLDGIFFIQGTDYVTINGINLADAAGNSTTTTQMEWGYALVKLQNTAPFDGCQFVTIQNCTVTLYRTNTASIGIYSGNHIATATTALSIAATTDATNNCTFRSNTVQNCNTAIAIRGYNASSPYTLYDQDNTVGGTSGLGNTLQNYGGASSGSGVNLQYQNNATVSYNTINNTAGGGIASTTALYGVYVQNGTNVSENISNNTFNMTQGTTSSAFYEVYIGCSGTGLINLNANTFTASGGSSGVMYMMYFSSGNTGINITNNNFYNINVATTSTLGLIYNSVAASPINMFCDGNYTSGTSAPYINKTGSGGTFYGYYNNSGSIGGSTTISNNTLSNISLTGSSSFYGIYETNGGSGQTKFMRNNTISNITTNGGTSYGLGLGYSTTQSITNCTVTNINVGAGAIYGIYIGSSSTLDTITNCRVSNLTSTGANVYGIGATNTFTTLRIFNDTVNSLTTSGASGLAYGIYQTTGTTIEIFKNTLYDISGTGANSSVNGMYLNAGTATVWNNLVGDLRTPNYTTATANSGTQLVGIYCGAGTAHNLYYNTVYINGTSSGANFGSSAVYAATSAVTFRNNIFVNRSTPNGTGIVAAYRRSSTTLTGYQSASDNNLFYAGVPAANKVIMYDGTTIYQTLNAYKALVAPRDAGSVTENPTFQSVVGGTANFLRPSLTVLTQIEGSAINISGITDDKYATVRAGNTGYSGTGTAPDLGAIEGEYLPTDLTPPSITNATLPFTCGTGNRTFTATITDLTGVPLTGGLMPRVYYKKGAGTWYSTAGTLTSGTETNGTWTFTIVATDMGGVAVGDVISYFIVAQDEAPTANIGYSSLGIVATDVNTVTTYPSSPSTYVINPSLSGTYTVGSTGAYSTLTAAIAAYTNSCPAGPVTFELIDATYPSETFPIVITANPYASSTNTLTIKPASGVAATITGTTSAAAVFKLLDAKYITIDGVNSGGSSLNVTNANTGTSCAIWLAAGTATGSGNTDIVLKNLDIVGGINTSTTNQGIVAGIDGATPANTAGMDNDYITIQNNTFRKCGYAIRAIGTAVTSVGGLNGWNITGNIIGPATYSATDNLGYNGMFLQNMVTPNISGNTIQNIGLTTSTSQIVGIYMQGNIDGATIDNNTIKNITGNGSNSGTSSVCGISMGNGVVNTTVSRNVITALSNTSASGYSPRGIIVNTANSSSNTLIVNNMISDLVGTSDASTTFLYAIIGIDIEGTSGGVKVYNNSVNLYGSHTGMTTATQAICFFANTSVTNLDVRNNIFVNTYQNSSSSLHKSWAILVSAASSAFATIDYNDYYVSAPNAIGQIGDIDRFDLATLQSGFGGNTNSLVILPAFVSPNDLHLQVVYDNALLAPGVSLPSVIVDIDGTARTSTPVIGAHEANFAPLGPSVAYTPLSFVCTSVDRTFTAIISDLYQGVPTAGSLVPRVYYRKNAGAWMSRPGTLSSGTSASGVWTFTILASDLGSIVSSDVISYYVIAQDNAGNVGASPMTGLVATDVNTVSTAPTTPSNYQVLNLSGTYTVGTGGDFATVTAAVNAYNNACLAGPVTFMLTDATYPSETFPITIAANAYASSTNTLTLRPASGVSPVISGNSVTSIFRLNGADYIILDGSNSGGTTRNLTLSNTNTNTAGNAVVWISSASSTNGATNNIIKNCIVAGASSTTTEMGIFSGGSLGTGAFYAGYNPAGANSNNIIRNNAFSKSQFGVWLKGSSTTALDQNNKVLSNSFGTAIAGEGFNAGGLVMELQNNAIASDNDIQNVRGTGGIDNVDGGSTVITGLYVRECTNAFVSGNEIFNFAYTGSGTNRSHVLYVESPSFNTVSTPSNNTIVNNAVYDARVTATGPSTWTISGISANGGYGDKFYYNTVNLTGVINVTSGPAAAFSNGNALTTVQTNAITVVNNIFVINGSSSASSASFFASYWRAAAGVTSSVLNNNDLRAVATSGGTAYTGYNGANRSSLSDWQTATSQEAASINTLPLFVSNTDPHLAVSAINVPLISGTPISGITTDIDSTTRSSTTPVLGVHEVNIPNCSGTPVAGVITASAASGCGAFSSNLSISGYTDQPGISYQWSSSSDGISFTPITGATTTSYGATVTVSTYYRATVTCSVSGVSASTDSMELVSNAVPIIAGTASACAGSSSTLTATPVGGTWISNNGTTASADATTGAITGVIPGTAVITYTDAITGCTNTAVFTVNPTPLALAITPAFSAICATGPAQLLTALHDSVVISPSFGTRQSQNTSSTYPAPLSVYYGGQRTQFLVLASELTAMGYSAGINLTALEFSVVSLGSLYTVNNNLQVRIAPVSAGTLSAFVTTGLVTVRNPASYTAAPGNNVIPFTTPYVWDGTSNLVVDVTFSNNMTGTTSYTAIQYNTSTSFPSTIVYRADGVTAATAAAATTVSLSYSARADFKLWARKDVPVTWTPTTGLYTDASASTAYSGAAATSVYALPTVNSTYTATSIYNGCSSSATAEVVVNPLPADIAGANTVCVGSTTTLTDDTTGGTWSSNLPANATVGSTTGVVTGISAGVVTMTYTRTATGCFKTMQMTVNPLPAEITGTTGVCESGTTTLTSADPGGTWSSDGTSIAVVAPATGVVTGVTAGFAQITYTLPTSCRVMQQVTVNPVPSVSVTPTPVPDLCFGGTATLTANSTMNEFALMSQDFNAGLGAWTITNIDGSTASYWQISPSPNGTSGATGDGTPMLAATPFDYASVTNTLFTSPSFSTVGYGAVTLSFNEFLMSLSSSDATVKVEYSTDGTSWKTVLDQMDAMTGTGAWSAASPEVSVALPAGALGQPNVQLRWNYNSLAGLWWNIDNIKVTAAQPAPSYTWSGAAGLSCTACTTTDVTPTATGANVYSVVGTTTAGCSGSVTASVSVNPLPSTISGTLVLCQGLTTTATDADAGGTWSTSATSIATINGTTGVISGVAGGNAEITYSLPTGCATTATVTVNPAPDSIDGVAAVCQGLTTTLTDVDGGGTWGTSASSIANIDASGVVTAVLAGTATITYTLPTGCITTLVVTVNPMPEAITGTMIVCQGVSTTLADGVTGGTWSTTATSIASVGSSTGVVTGVSAGVAQVTYTAAGGCFVTADVTVNASPATIGGAPEVCIGAVTALTDSDPGGTWSTGATGIATISSGGVVTGVSMGTATVTYALSASCLSTTVVTVDPLPAPIAGPSQLCVDATGTFTDGTPGGTWSSSTTAVATIDNTTGVANAVASGTTIITFTSAAGCVRTRVFTVNALPAAITGPSEVCKASTIALADATAGGTWSSGAGAIATINSSGVLSGVSDGVAPITYTLTTGCTAVTNVTVNPLPTAISGTTSMCLGQSTSLTNGLAGGTWSSATPANALVDATTGVVTGVGVGSSVISYTMPTGCGKSVVVVVNAVPSAVTGATNVCQGATTTMTNTTAGGVWTSTTTSVASINLTTGVVTGLAAGTTNISYTLVTGGCSATYTISVDAMPATFTGALTVCSGQTTALSSTTTGGTWSSSNITVATIGTSGVVSGVTAGTSIITYALPSGCMRTAIVTVNALPAVYNVTGGGSYCTGGSGVHIGLDNSNGGVNYQLYSGASTVGSPVTGVTAMPVDFGFIAPIGTYSVVGTSATTGCSSNMTGIATVSVSSAVPASISFTTSTGSDTVCSGVPVTFTATAVNGGTTPVYQWRVNGVIMGTAANTYTYTPATGDVVTINMSSSIACATPSVATASRTLIVDTSVMPVAGITVVPGASICQGSSALFNASSLYGGSAPVYLWYKNGVYQLTGSSYSYVPSNGDNVFVKLVSNQTCAIEDSVSSGVITMTVSPVFLPVVSINATPGTMVETGTSVTMTATVSNGGPSPEYQWYIGSAAIAGATSATFTYSMYVNGDSVSCRVNGTGACGQAGFNSLIMHVGATGIAATPGTADVRLMPNPNKGEFTVKGTLSVKADKEVAIEVTNMLGQVVYRTNVMAHGGIVDTKIKLDNTLANGMYMLNMISGDDRKVFHFVLEQ